MARPDSEIFVGGSKPAQQWRVRQPYGPKLILGLLFAAVLLALSARHTQIDKMLVMTAEWAAQIVGLRPSSEVGKGAKRFADTAFPLVFHEEAPVSRIEKFDRNNLPWLSHLETRTVESARYDFDRNEMVADFEKQEFLVKPVGYLVYVCEKMIETLEMALWATLLSIVISLPLAYFGARNYSPNRFTYSASRLTSSFLRAMPELVAALFLVLMYGFGPIAGVLALGLHCAGFFGKFYADDIENAERGPQEALIATGAGKLAVLRYAVIPQVLPQYIAYTQYILERNVRMATVIGVVGAGGIGIELKGRFDMFDFGHVSTILLVIFLTVLGLERISQWLRKRIIR
ncbi:MAG: phosphonate ABC transporter, permease protein PhnE [Planctomycetes bacterium]|nr:phosphonate ABC transporter, permease protein PhnE [Planctomycetota bacterium]